MSIRGVIVAIFLLTLLRNAFADTFVIGTPGGIGAAYSGATVGNALAAGIDLANTKAKANAQLVAARRRFFAEYPNGRNFAQAEKEFAELLWEGSLFHVDQSPDRLS